MACTGVAQLGRERVDAHERHGDHLVLVLDVPQHPLDDRRRRLAFVRIGTEGGPLRAHHRRGADPAAAHVADAELDEAVGAADGVVPVAADLDGRRPAR